MPNIKTFAYTPVLGWSVSRYDVFSICKRRYFYHYYAKYDRKTPTRRIEGLKELVSVPLETGAIVHEVIAGLLGRLTKSAADLDTARFFNSARQTTERHLKTVKFQETVYATLPAVELDAVFPKVQESLQNLLASTRYRWLVDIAAAHADEWIVDPPGYGESRLGDLKVYCKVDFLFPIGSQYHIIDWKTGKADTDKHRKQLMGYSTWAACHFGVTPENVIPTLAYLHPTYLEVQETFDASDLETFSIQVRAETEEMRGYCRDREQNIPLGIAEFAMSDDARVCELCNFRELCHPAQYHAYL